MTCPKSQSKVEAELMLQIRGPNLFFPPKPNLNLCSHLQSLCGTVEVTGALTWKGKGKHGQGPRTTISAS